MAEAERSRRLRRLPWRRGPEHAIALGVAVFGVPEPGPEAVAELFGRHERLTAWLAEGEHSLTYDADGLALVEAMIDSWRGERRIAPMIGNEVGTFLGAVLVDVVPQAAWHVWPNGHPVVRLPSGRDLDVVAVVHRRVEYGRPSLTAVLTRARRL